MTRRWAPLGVWGASRLVWMGIWAMRWADMTVTVELWAYRFGGFVVQHVLDDPAWLALMFC